VADTQRLDAPDEDRAQLRPKTHDPARVRTLRTAWANRDIDGAMYAAAYRRLAEPASGALGRALSMVAIVTALFVSRPARAQTTPGAESVPCSDGRLRVDGELSEDWRNSVVRLCDALSKMRDVDPSVRLRIVPADDDVLVEATLGDGRAAIRRVHSPDDLAFTVEALVALPAEPTPQPAPVTTAPATTVPIAAPPERSSPESATWPQPASRGLGVEIGGALMGRVAGAPTYLMAGPEFYAGLRPGKWLFALTFRWEPVAALTDPAPSGFDLDSAGAGFMLAHRIFQGSVTFDAGFNAILLADRETYDNGEREVSDTDGDMRVGLLGRLLFGGPEWRWTITMEAEASPLRVSGPLRVAPGLPTLPTWALGLGVGAAWEEQ
jgi:hypothetical protein